MLSSSPLLGHRRHSVGTVHEAITPRRSSIDYAATDADSGQDSSAKTVSSDFVYGQHRPSRVDNTPSAKKRRLSWGTLKHHPNRSGPIQIPEGWKNSSSDPSILSRASSSKGPSQTDSTSGTESLSDDEMDSIDELLAQLVSETQEKGFVDNFLWTSSYFIEPVELLERLIDFYSSPVSEFDSASYMVVRFRLINTMKKLIELNCQPSETVPVEWLNRLNAFIDQLNKGSESDQSCAKHLTQKLIEVNGAGHKTNSNEKSEVTEQTASSEANPGKADATPYITGEKFNIMQDRPIDIAEQLTLRDFEMFQAIPTEIFRKKRFEKEMEDPTSTLSLFIAKFNEISLWIATQIVSASNSEANKELIGRFIEIMRELRKLNNFNAVMAFFSALNLGSVSGFVTRCFTDLPDDLIQCFNSIRKLMDHSMNFKSYRETLEMAEPPCIPYLGLFMRDLMHLEELPSTEGPLVNWHKLSRVGKTLSQLAKFRRSAYSFVAIPHIHKFVRNIGKYSVILSESQLYTLSRAIIHDEADASEALLKIDAPKLLPATSDSNLHDWGAHSDALPDRAANCAVPPWVVKREVRDQDGNKTTFEEVIADRTVICVFMRQFVSPPKSSFSLSLIKPFLDELDVKLIAVGSGNSSAAAAFKQQVGFVGEVYFDEANHLFEDFKAKRGWKKAQFNKFNRSKLASILGCDEGDGEGNSPTQLGGTFMLRGDQILFEHVEQFAGDNVDTIQLLRKVGAKEGLLARIGVEVPKANSAEQKKAERKIQKLEEKLVKLRAKTAQANDAPSSPLTSPLKKAMINIKASLPLKRKQSSPELKRIKDQQKEAILQIKLEYYKKKRDQLIELEQTAF